AYPGEAPRSANSPRDAAHILFTSGSTGMPKGVVITHANVRHFIDWAVPYFGTAPTDRISGHPPLHFDLSPFDVFGTFAAGAALRPVAPGEVGQLCIRGVGLRAGCWRDAEKTRGAFLPYPGSSDPQDRIYRTGDLASVGADGLIRFLGRADSQIKARGYRIELGEIEVALHPVETLQECAVVGVPSRDL